MKRTILLFAALLCLGTAAPLVGYRLGGGSLALLSTQYSDATENATPTPSANLETGGQALADFWGSDGAEDTSSSAQGDADQATSGQGEDTTDSAAHSSTALAPLLIYDEGSGEILTVSVRDYLIGAVASELPMTWPDAALQAQAIACHSYILYCKENADTAALGGAYLSADPARRQGFMTDEVLQSYWGDDYATNYARLSALVDEVLDVVVLYDGEAAATSYFAISNGTTETSEAVWGTALPYLISVDSSADTAAEGYIVSTTYTTAQIESTLATVFGLAVGSDSGIAAGDYFGARTMTDAGYIATIEVCGTTIAGTVLRSAFGLRSSCFWVDYNSDGTFTITTAGYGHGVGLSQWGAKFMADDGSSYAEILAHYYPNTTLGSALSM